MLEDPSRGGRQRQINRCRSWRRVGRRQYFVTELPRLHICNLIEELWIFPDQCEQQVFRLDSGRPGFRCFITAKENDSACPLGEYFKHDCVVCYLSRLQLAMRNVWTRMCRKSAGRARAKLPSWDRRGSEPRNEASGVVLQKCERSEPPSKPRDSASFLFSIRSAARKYKEARFARVYLVPPHSPRSSARCPSYPEGVAKWSRRLDET